MFLNSLDYFFFLTLAVILYYLFPFKIRWIFLVITSYYFCYNISVLFLLPLMLLTVLTFFGGLLIFHIKKNTEKKFIFIFFVGFAITILFLFKYCNLIEKLSPLLPTDSFLKLPPYYANILLPIGISYYSFQALSYLTDIYIGKVVPEKNFGIFSLYLSFFPKFLQGPIERAGILIPQFRLKRRFNYNYFISGSKLILFGLFKKVVIADRLSPYVERVFSDVSSYHGLTLGVVVVFFAIQMYADFSGYTDMALGSATFFGIDLTDNFNCPYLAKNIQDFWRRWHITLSSWVRDYIYIPLSFMTRSFGYIGFTASLISAFLILGLWHGAAKGYIIFGFIHGIFFSISALTQKQRDSFWKQYKVITPVKTFFERLIVLSIVLFSFVFFRAKSVSDSFYIIGHFFDFSNTLFDFRPYSKFLLNTILILSFFVLEYFIKVRQTRETQPWLKNILYIYIIFSVILYGKIANEFIYIAF
ncbi:MAG: hypothetical protein COS99_08745 [Candidatus Omnitrophica bacterium CG07_land_8_20_14_0_80_42_15]|uniref:Membrane-bound O-acyltransferase family protein n=1 Tax=Candidatus Aquitaenariimonas noxiae TaxID=1974741 RepID=A0A2J0L0P4_9BACT|nr:MAG: hypothetical protein COS99_08745 [Candidatus Omnitrophica bacterium CG07_land_8_20_14_0_80_42_15]